MMKTVIMYKGLVYYKVEELKDLYDVPMSQIIEAIETKQIETTTLDGFGQTKFIREANVSLIFDGEKSITVETAIETKVNGKVEVYDEAKVTAKREAKAKAKAERKEESKLAKERGKLKRAIRELYQKFITDKQVKQRAIIKAKHLGEDNLHFMKDLLILQGLHDELTTA